MTKFEQSTIDDYINQIFIAVNATDLSADDRKKVSAEIEKQMLNAIASEFLKKLSQEDQKELLDLLTSEGSVDTLAQFVKEKTDDPDKICIETLEKFKKGYIDSYQTSLPPKSV